MEKAVIFIDGNNFFKSLEAAGVPDRGRLDYAKISKKITTPRDWLETRYYIGKVTRAWSQSLERSQRRFRNDYLADDGRCHWFYGRFDIRPAKIEGLDDLKKIVEAQKDNLPVHVYNVLMRAIRQKLTAKIQVEKAVDVMLAVDMVRMALDDEYDTAYLFSADGDFTPAVELARAKGKKVFAVSLDACQALAKVVNSYIRLDRNWFNSCYRTT